MNIPQSAPDAETTCWRRVSEVVDLAEIFEPDVQVCSWRRVLDPSIVAYLGSINHLGTLQALETLGSDDRAKLSMLPEGVGRERLVDDLALLTEILCELMDCPAVGFRGTRIKHAMCPKWHIDRVPMRLLCTYEGAGTEWLENQNIAPGELSRSEVLDGACQQAIAGEVVLLKGGLWQNNEGKGAIHRSPVSADGAHLRTLVSLDPIWLD